MEKKKDGPIQVREVEVNGRVFIRKASLCLLILKVARISRAKNHPPRKQAERALRDSEKLYRAIGESIKYGVWVCLT